MNTTDNAKYRYQTIVSCIIYCFLYNSSYWPPDSYSRKNLIQSILFLHLFYLNHTKSSTILFLKATIHFKWRLSSPIFSRENAIFCMNRFSIIWFKAAYIYTNGIIYECYFALIWISLPKFRRKTCSFSCFKSMGVELWINLRIHSHMFINIMYNRFKEISRKTNNDK